MRIPICLILALAVMSCRKPPEAGLAPVIMRPVPPQFTAAPLQRDDAGGHFFTPVILDQFTGNFLVDSGAGMGIVASAAFAERLDKPADINTGEVTGVDGAMMSYTILCDRITLPKAYEATNPSVRVIDLSRIEMQAADGQRKVVDGLLGAMFLKSSRAVLDVAADRMLIPSADVALGTFQALCQSSGDLILPLTHSSTQEAFPFVELQIHGQKFAFLIDTGSRVNTIEPAVALALQLKLQASDVSLAGANGLSDKKLDFARIELVRFAGIVLPQLDFFVVATGSAPAAPQGTRFGGLIGSGLLTALHASLDFDSYSLIIPRSLTHPLGSQQHQQQ